MLEMVLPIAFTLLALSVLLSFIRLLKGPDLPDRILALDTLYINAIALVVLLDYTWTRHCILKPHC